LCTCDRNIYFVVSELKKLSEESLTRQPEEVFDIICKLGEGSYGSVYKALHKESGQVLAIKQVPVDTDLQEIIKEISIMQQCDSPYVVKYYGSYFKNTDLWVSTYLPTPYWTTYLLIVLFASDRPSIDHSRTRDPWCQAPYLAYGPKFV